MGPMLLRSPARLSRRRALCRAARPKGAPLGPGKRSRDWLHAYYRTGRLFSSSAVGNRSVSKAFGPALMQMELHEKEEDVQHIEHITKRYVPIDDGGASVSWINSANTSHGFVLEREARASTISSRSSSGRFAVNVSPSKVTSP